MSIENQKAKLDIKNFLLHVIYDAAYKEVYSEIRILVTENIQLSGLYNHNVQYYLYYRGTKYFEMKHSLSKLISDFELSEQMDINLKIKNSFIQKISDLEEIKEERNIINFYLSHLLTECNSAADMYAVFPDTIKKYIKLSNTTIQTLTEEEIKVLSVRFKQYHDILIQRIFINMLILK